MNEKTNRLDTLTDDELRKLSLIKGRKGNASAVALQAQRILCRRSGKDFKRDRAKTASDDYCYGDPIRFTKKFK